MRKNLRIYKIMYWIAVKSEQFEDFCFKWLGLDYFEHITLAWLSLYMFFVFFVVASSSLLLTTYIFLGIIIIPLIGMLSSNYVGFKPSPQNKRIGALMDEAYEIWD